jgi:hypothetical protein
MSAPTHLTVLRSSALLACERSVRHPIDADLDREAGMDGNLARRLQAARDLHGEVGVSLLLAAERLSDERHGWHPVQAEFAREAGMDGDLQRLLQAAHDLDAGTV